METKTIDEFDKLKKQIEKAIRRRKFYESMDFKWAHIFTWISILSSFCATIIIASGKVEFKIFTAIIAGIPGLVILIDKSFDFKKRAIWGALFRLELEELYDQICFAQIEAYKASVKFREINRKYELSYSKIGFFTQKKDDEVNGVVS